MSKQRQLVRQLKECIHRRKKIERQVQRKIQMYNAVSTYMGTIKRQLVGIMNGKPNIDVGKALPKAGLECDTIATREQNALIVSNPVQNTPSDGGGN